MKRFYVLFATLLSLNVCVPPVMYAQEGDPIGAGEAPKAIVISDTNLSAAIRSTLGLAEDATLTATDMLNLMSLEAKKAEISDLRGLEHATNLTTLNLYGNQLTDLSPLSGLEGLISLDLGKNTITNIEALKGLTALTTLYLDRNQLTDFGPLSSLTGLSVLHLSRTGISDVSVLENLTTLTQLYLTGNEISDISALSTLTEVGWLFLAQNEISDVSPLVGMEALVSLRLLGNPVSNASVLYPLTQGSLIDVDIEILRPFVSVCDRTPQVRDAIVAALPNVSDCADVTAADLASITDLNLSTPFPEPNITALKANDFNGLTALERLDLSGNELSSLPDGIFDDLTALTVIDLSWNNLSSLPVGIFDDLIALTHLILPQNGLSSLPDGIFDKLTALIYLHLSDNELGSLPMGIFDELTALIYLNLHENGLSSLPDGIFDDLTALTNLYLYSNELGSLPAGIFDELTALKWLELQANGLSSLPSGIFDELTALIYLSLHENDLRGLQEDIFDKLTALESLNLSWNKLSSLPYSIFDGLTALESLDLSRNTVDPLPLMVSLEQVGEGEFKATARTGAPFDIVLPLVVTHGSIEDGGAPSVTISTGKMESESVKVSRTPGAADAVWVDIGTLPGLPENSVHSDGRLLIHSGYELVKSADLPLTVIDGPGNAAPGIASGVILPDETTLSANYPNPFNPETWIPYQLANPSDVVISIYDGRGTVVRRLELGHQPAGYYTHRSRAAYWDGRNDLGERVASGLYFYHLQADNMSLLRKMLILK